jgi:hypothetical protein
MYLLSQASRKAEIRMIAVLGQTVGEKFVTPHLNGNTVGCGATCYDGKHKIVK